MADGNITKDAMYDAVAPDDFVSMLEIDRYNNRSSAFDKIISATHDHFWDPLNTAYIDFSEPFDTENEALMPETMFPALQTDYVKNAPCRTPRSASASSTRAPAGASPPSCTASRAR